MQEAFGLLLNAHEILGVTNKGLHDETEGEAARRWVYEKLHRPTSSVCGSLGSAPIAAEAYSLPSEPFVLGAVVDPRVKLHIILCSTLLRVCLCLLRYCWHPCSKGLPANQYLRNPFLSPDNDSKLQSAFPLLSVESWTDASIIYMHFFCMRFLEQREPMQEYMHII